MCSHCLSVTKEKIQKICVGTLRFTMAAFGNLGPKSIWDRAQPNWSYEFPDRTGPDTQICRTGPAGLNWIWTLNILTTKYIWVINSQRIRSLYTNLVSKVPRPNKKPKKYCEKNLIILFLNYWFFFFLFLKALKVRHPVFGHSGFRKFVRFPDLIWDKP